MANNVAIHGELAGRLHAIPVDPFTHAVHATDTVHLRIHAGQAFAYHAKLTITAGASAYLLAKPTSNIHFQAFDIKATGGPAEARLFEAPTTTANGTAATAYNRNRASTTTSNTSIFTGPTVTADGVELDLFALLQTGPGNSATSNESMPHEWILKAGTDYTLKFTNTSAGSIDVYFSFIWYEQV
jgi:hypothetical protein